MKLTLEPTTREVEVGGITARVWEGRTDCGLAVTALIPRLYTADPKEQRHLDAEVREAAAAEPFHATPKGVPA